MYYYSSQCYILGHSLTMDLLKPCTSLSVSTLYSQLNSVFLVFPREYLDISSANVTTLLQVLPFKGMQLYFGTL